MKHRAREIIAARILVMSKDCAPAVATVPIVLVVNGLETVGGTVPAVNAMAVAMLLVVEPSVLNGFSHSPGKVMPQLAHSAAVV